MKAKGTLVTMVGMGLVLAVMAAMGLGQAPGRAQAQEPGAEGAGPEAPAQILAGNAFTYQGYLTDGGSPANGLYDFFFSLYADAAGTQWVTDADAVANVSVVDGLFTAVVDVTDAMWGDVYFYLNGDARWLRIGVRPGASTGAYTYLTPLQPLTPAPYALALPGLNTVQNSTSANVLGGYSWNYADPNVVGGTISGGGHEGGRNEVYGDYATVGGGRINDARQGDDTVAGGASNTADGGDATVGGGEGNTAGAACAVVAGGCGNVANNVLATVGGGDVNYATAERATIGGGSGNSASGPNATIGGGSFNNTGAEFGTIGGGDHNRVSAIYGTIGGGGGPEDAEGNRVTDPYGTVGGGYQNEAGNGNANSEDAHYATVAGGYGNQASNVYATVGGGEWNGAGGAFATIAGGQNNTASGGDATVAGGFGNRATALAATVGGGGSNRAAAKNATIGGGYGNEISGEFGFIGGGGGVFEPDGNLVTDHYGVVGGGNLNRAGNDSEDPGDAQYATVAGGYENQASGWYATVPGGYDNTAAGNYSLAAGRQAQAKYSGCFVWGDSSSAEDVGCYGPNRTVFRNAGGIFIYTNAPLTSGVRVVAGGSSWSAVSDRALKENVEVIDYVELLERLATEVPVTTWNYIAQDDSIRHIGPMAQDLYRAFGVGEDEQHITTVDADGVALAAIQGLYELTQAQAARMEALEAEATAQQADLSALQAQMEGLEDRLCQLERGNGLAAAVPTGHAAAWLLLPGLVVGAGVVVQRRRSGGGQ
jgi:hypothetical protein